MTISSWLNFVRPAPPGRGSAAGRNFLAPRAVFASLSAFSILNCDCDLGALGLHSNLVNQPGDGWTEDAGHQTENENVFIPLSLAQVGVVYADFVARNDGYSRGCSRVNRPNIFLPGIVSVKIVSPWPPNWCNSDAISICSILKCSQRLLEIHWPKM